MDSRRFDAIARSAAIPATRRSALGALISGSILGAFGLDRTDPARALAQGQDGLCVLAFVATVRQGPSASRPLVAGGAPGELRGSLRFFLARNGNLQDADLLLDDGSSLPVVGQASGYGFQARIDLGQGQALVAVGVGEQDVTRCLGRLDGPATGPEVGDLSEWHAAAGVQNLPSGSGGASQGGAAGALGAAGGSQTGGSPASGSGGRGNRPNSGGSQSSTGGSQSGGGAQSGSGSQSGGGGSTGGGSTGGGSGQGCPSGQTRCGNACVDLQTDPLNCGACGDRCAVNTCTRGVCGEAGASVQNCAPPFGVCGDACVDLSSDARNCGRCGNACPFGEKCSDGSCKAAGGSSSGGSSASAQSTQTCPSGQTRCGDACVDVQTDTAHCGQCDHPCASELGAGTCIDGVCTCRPDTTRCDNVCVNTDRDPVNCGRCGTQCTTDQECVGGACAAAGSNSSSGNSSSDGSSTSPQSAQTCPSGQTRCGDVCTDVQTDPTNCGACSKACAAGETCTGGTCTSGTTTGCPAAQVRCNGACVEALPNFGSEGISCPGGGAAPTECPAGRVLCNGACFPEGACQSAECAPGWGYCYGVCRDFQNDPGYCGGCGGACTGGTFCKAGTCVTCPEGQTLCSAGCVDTKTDLNNCGFCGNLCGTQCIDGQCTGVGPAPECVPGTTRCGNDCVDLTKNAAHCGACGTACPPDSYCAPPGTCEYCEPGLALCGDTCVDISSDINNCGACGYRCPPDSLGRAPGGCVTVGARIACAYPPISGPGAPNNQQTLAPADATPCAPGLVDCGGGCVDVASDPLNCGTCGADCGTGFECQGGLCTALPTSSDTTTLTGDQQAPVSCPEVQVDCGGVCTDLSVDPLNCGSCGFVCAADATCQAGQCAPGDVNDTTTIVQEEPPASSCPEGQVDCGGVCTDLTVDPLNCGGCFTACAAEDTCQNGQCSATVAVDNTTSLVGDESASSCPEGQVDCGGYCADVFSDPYNCGGCDVICGAGITCDFGVCSEDTANAPAEDQAATAPDDGGTTCAAPGEACDPASPSACCSGVCNDDGTCA